MTNSFDSGVGASVVTGAYADIGATYADHLAHRGHALLLAPAARKYLKAWPKRSGTHVASPSRHWRLTSPTRWT